MADSHEALDAVYQENDDDTEQREGMNETDYEGQHFAGGHESSEQSPVKSTTGKIYIDANKLL